MVDKITKKEREILEVMQDPVQWVTQHVGKPRWYQELVLRHPHHRMVLRMGRRLGKCIAGTERIMDPGSGRYKTVQELYDSGVQTPRLYSLNTDTHKKVHTNAFHIEDNGMKEVFELKLVDGSKVNLTGNHPVLTKAGWTEIENLNYNDEVAVPTNLPYSGGVYVSPEEIKDWVENNVDLPEDIYEWAINSLDIFLLTYMEKYSLTEDYYDSETYYLDGVDFCFDTEELAKEFKHLFLRLGKTSVLGECPDHKGYFKRKGYRLTVRESPACDYRYIPIKKITSKGLEQTYDVHVPEYHNLVVEDIFVHNTWTMASHMLWVAMTAWGGRLAQEERRGIDILVVTPYDIQAKEIYNTLNDMIDNNEALASSLQLRRQGPPREIKFLNGSTIKLFTAGTSSSSNAASIRGQRADFVYLDKKLCPLYS